MKGIGLWALPLFAFNVEVCTATNIMVLDSLHSYRIGCLYHPYPGFCWLVVWKEGIHPYYALKFPFCVAFLHHPLLAASLKLASTLTSNRCFPARFPHLKPCEMKSLDKLIAWLAEHWVDRCCCRKPPHCTPNHVAETNARPAQMRGASFSW